MSSGRTELRSTRANNRSAWSPASCPCVSFRILKWSRSPYASEYGVPSRVNSRTRFSRLRRFHRPVRGSVRACVSDFSNARSIAMRSDARRVVISRYLRSSSSGGEPSGPMACTTPELRPVMLIATHAAESSPVGRPTRWGHAFSAWLEGNTTVWPRRVAGHSSGETTPHPDCASASAGAPVWSV